MKQLYEGNSAGLSEYRSWLYQKEQYKLVSLANEKLKLDVLSRVIGLTLKSAGRNLCYTGVPEQRFYPRTGGYSDAMNFQLHAYTTDRGGPLSIETSPDGKVLVKRNAGP